MKIINTIIRIDKSIHHYVLQYQKPWLIHLMNLITFCGSGAFAFLLYVSLFVFSDDTNLVFSLICADCIGLLIIICLRYLTKRERPLKDINQRFFDPWNRYSFPSLHAMRVTMFASLFSMTYPTFSYALILGAICIALSRLYIQKHYLSDITVGALIGLTTSWLSLGINGMG
ncbi:MAG: phosphatase PAP2 family protein [Desulfobacterales bacterium]|nr:phosphatase PAP2 family protein [Desulfobacterales bacterium]